MNIFISYGAHDGVAALALKHVIEDAGHEASLACFESQPNPELDTRSPHAELTFLLVSSASVRSPWVQRQCAAARRTAEERSKMIPILLRSCAIPESFNDLILIDASRDPDNDAMAERARAFLDGAVSETIPIDAKQRTELEDRRSREEAEEAFPAIERTLQGVLDEPLRALTLEIDHDSWPLTRSGIVELALDLGSGVSPARFLIAPYVEGATWARIPGIEEREPSEFFGSEKPRVDARFLWGNVEEILRSGRDGTDLGEQPLALNLELDGREVEGKKLELPSLRQLFERRCAFSLWDHSAARPVELAATGLDMRLVARVRSAELFGGVCVWRSRHERDESVLLSCPTLSGFPTRIQREVSLGAYLRKGLRRAATSQERRRRLVEALDAGADVPELDRWAALHLLLSRARSARLRRTNAEAVEFYERAMSYGLAAFLAGATSYSEAFRVWDAAQSLFALLQEAGRVELLQRHASVAVDFARAMRQREPNEPDYARAVSHAFLLRAELASRCDAEIAQDLREAAAIIAELELARPDLSWRRVEAAKVAERVVALWPKSVPWPELAAVLSRHLDASGRESDSAR